VGLGVVVRGGVGCALVGSRRLLSGSNGGKGGGELSERLVERHSCVSYWKATNSTRPKGRE
jgi:hypothetical protein